MSSVVDALRGLIADARFGRFLSVGAVGAVVDNAALVAAVELLGVAPVAAKAASAEAAIVVMFALNERWTFADFGRRSPLAVVRRFLTSNVVRAGGALVALAVLFVLHDLANVWYLLANLIGIGVGFLVNYAAESLITWRVRRDDD